MLFFAAAAGSTRPNAQTCKHRTVDNSRFRPSPLMEFIIVASILLTLIESLLHPGLAPMARLKQISLQLVERQQNARRPLSGRDRDSISCCGQFMATIRLKLLPARERQGTARERHRQIHRQALH